MARPGDKVVVKAHSKIRQVSDLDRVSDPYRCVAFEAKVAFVTDTEVYLIDKGIVFATALENIGALPLNHNKPWSNYDHMVVQRDFYRYVDSVAESLGRTRSAIAWELEKQGYINQLKKEV